MPLWRARDDHRALRHLHPVLAHPRPQLTALSIVARQAPGSNPDPDPFFWASRIVLT